MLSPKSNYVECEAPISPEDALKIEGIFFEKVWRKNILTYIKRNGIQVPQELMAAYRKEYVDFAAELKQAIAGCIVKYAKRCPKKCRNARVNFKRCKVYWIEEVPHAKEN